MGAPPHAARPRGFNGGGALRWPPTMQAGSAVPARMAAAYQRPDEGISGGMVAELGSAATPSLAGMPPGAVLVRVLVTSICGSDLAGRCCATLCEASSCTAIGTGAGACGASVACGSRNAYFT